MNKTGFMKFLRDCNIPCNLKECTYELLWVRVLRNVGLIESNHVHRKKQFTNLYILLVQAGKELELEHFKKGLITIAKEMYKDRPTFTVAQMLEALLLT